MIAKLFLQNLIWIVAMGALLLVPAGTLRWPAAWVFMGTIAISAYPADCGWPGPIRRCSPNACTR